MPVTDDAVSDHLQQFEWKTQPLADRWVTRAIDALVARNPIIEKLAYELRKFTGTRLVDWVDHIAFGDTDSLGLIGELADVGFSAGNRERRPDGAGAAVRIGGSRPLGATAGAWLAPG
jgi:hypothetical protein